MSLPIFDCPLTLNMAIAGVNSVLTNLQGIPQTAIQSLETTLRGTLTRVILFTYLFPLVVFIVFIIMFMGLKIIEIPIGLFFIVLITMMAYLMFICFRNDIYAYITTQVNIIYNQTIAQVQEKRQKIEEDAFFAIVVASQTALIKCPPDALGMPCQFCEDKAGSHKKEVKITK